MDNLILNSQKKEVFDLITQFDLEPANFFWDEENSTYDYSLNVSCLRFADSIFFFKFDFVKNSHYCIYSPAEDKIRVESHPGSWQLEVQYVIKWLSSLKREISIIDPWDEIEKYIPGENVDFKSEGANEPFTFSQVEHITKSLNKLKEEIDKNYTLNQEQAAIVQSKLDYLIDRAKNIGRLDWKNIFVSTIINIAFILAMDVEQAKLLWNLVKICFRGILLLGGK